jgi:AraC-like DNA-binding protein
MQSCSKLSTAKYLLLYRIVKSLELLFYTENFISEIAFNIGFNNPSNFIRSFKRELGLSPKVLKMRFEKDMLISMYHNEYQ